MDRYDSKILQLLVENARITGADIARKINLSLPAVTERLRKLDRSGYIEKYTIKVNRQQVNLQLLAFIGLDRSHQKRIGKRKSHCIKRSARMPPYSRRL